MTRTFAFKRTCELSLAEQQQFRQLFTRTFGKPLTQEQFERKYLGTPLGYSHHGLMYAEGQLVGTYNLIPYLYHSFGAQRLFGLAVYLMIATEHRGGPFSISEMARLVYAGAKQDGVGFVFGFPEDFLYPFQKRVLCWRYIGDLHFYALPINIGAIVPRLKWANRLSRLCAGGLVRLPQRKSSPPPQFAVEKVCDAAFEAYRYDRRHVTDDLGGGGKCTYTIHTEKNGVKTLYIMDVLPLAAEFFARAVRHVYEIAVRRADVVLYIGRLPFRPLGLVRVPRSKQPFRIRLCGRILDPQLVDERVFLMENWSINTSNIELR
jgi:hypothetical protein